jgi:hypothetical protein
MRSGCKKTRWRSTGMGRAKEELTGDMDLPTMAQQMEALASPRKPWSKQSLHTKAEACCYDHSLQQDVGIK